MSRIRKTILNIEVDDKEYNVQYTGKITEVRTKEELKHDTRLMDALIASDELLNFFYRIVMPVVRFKRREAKKKGGTPCK